MIKSYCSLQYVGLWPCSNVDAQRVAIVPFTRSVFALNGVRAPALVQALALGRRPFLALLLLDTGDELAVHFHDFLPLLFPLLGRPFLLLSFSLIALLVGLVG